MSALSWRRLGDPVVFVCSGFGSGFLPWAPGTWGSAAALAVWWWLLASMAWWWQLGVVAAVFLIGVVLSEHVGRRYGVHDHPAIVIDEFAGLWLGLVGVKAGWLPALVGFAVFRVLDALKPWPIRWMDARIGGGLGVMLDDIAAGVLTLVVLHVAF